MTIKRTAQDMEDEHKDIVISNVEFCIMQFYKSQFEAAQERIAQLTKTNKKQKRELDHRDFQLRQLNGQQDALLATNTQLAQSCVQLRQTNENLQTMLLQTQTMRDTYERSLYKCELTNLKFMSKIEKMFLQHPELDHEYRDEVTKIVEDALLDADNAIDAIPLLNLATGEELSDSETESESE